MDTPHRKLGDRIRSVRIQRKMLVQEVAERAGITQGGLSLIELGRKDPHLTTLVRIAAALQVHVTELLPEAWMGEVREQLRKGVRRTRRSSQPSES